MNRLSDLECQEIEKMAAMQDDPWPPPVFTHGDLNPSNILIRGDKIVAIIDWEFAACYPKCWEYTSVWYGNRTTTDWQNALEHSLKPYPKEMEM